MGFMIAAVNNLIKSSFKAFNIGIIRYDALQKLIQAGPIGRKAQNDIEFLTALRNQSVSNIIANLDKSRSQLKQDLFALSELDFKANGYFVEVGAANGIDSSNTYLMEKSFGWAGIVAEPARCWHQDLRANRCVNIETDCVWKDSHSSLEFNEVDSAWYSTINAYSDTDSHSEIRKSGKTYNVKSISLNDLLAKYGAPENIDYLSIDTEGSELEILSSFDFRKHSFKVITCEHNYTPMRDKIFDLLSGHGYVRKFEELSKFDDWYVKAH